MRLLHENVFLLNRAKIEGSPSENKAYIIDQTYMRMKCPKKMMKWGKEMMKVYFS